MHRSGVLFLMLLTLAAVPAGAQHFSDWTTPVHLANPNSAGTETAPHISKDGLSLYFACSDCPGGFGGNDLYVSRRGSVQDPWGPPENLGATVNTAYQEGNPRVSIDGHRLYFTSDRPGGYGGNDLWVSRRHNKRDDFGWRAPENLGPAINTSANESQASVYEDESSGDTFLYFSSDRPGGMGGDDVYASMLQADETFGPAVLVVDLSSPNDDRGPSIRRDGLEVYITSNRQGSMLNLKGLPSYDLWVSTRPSTADPWPIPVNVDPLGAIGINTGKHEGGPALSFDGMTMYFQAAQRSGNFGVGCPAAATCFFDIWMSTRTKLPDNE